MSTNRTDPFGDDNGSPFRLGLIPDPKAARYLVGSDAPDGVSTLFDLASAGAGAVINSRALRLPVEIDFTPIHPDEVRSS